MYHKVLHRLPLTQIKIGIAHQLYRLLRLFGIKDEQRVTRGDINFSLDLREGLDLSLFLFGNFQRHVSRNKYLQIPPDGIIMDVGANIGIMSLQFARLVPQGRVYAFEPTHYALSKLQNNLALNPGLAKRIQVTQAFVAEAPGEIELVAYSSWRIDGHRAGDEHPVHGGAPQATQGIPATSIDAVVAQERLQRLDFIKIDTDGHEYDVLQGAMHTLEQLRPQVIFELGLYVMKERGISFQHYQDLFEKMNYRLYLSHNKKPIHAQNYTQHIPARGTIDVLALPTASS